MLNPYHASPLATLLHGDVLETLAGLPAESVDVCITSPPYYGLRLYAGDQGKVPYGLEATPEAYIARTIEILRAIRRVLKPTGSLFLNLGDSYSGSNSGSNDYRAEGSSISKNDATKYQGQRPGTPYKPLDLCGIPEQVVLAARADGWYWRSTIIWQKENPMPESVRGWSWEPCRVKVGSKPGKDGGGGVEHWNQGGQNLRQTQWADCPGCSRCLDNDGYVLRRGSGRPTSSFEYLYMLTPTSDYFYDTESVREAHSPDGRKQTKAFLASASHENYQGANGHERWPNAGRNLRNVWSIATQPFSLELCKSCKRIYDQKRFRRLSKSLDSACSNCGGLVMVSPDEWATWYCVDCGASYSKSEVNRLGKRRICHCGSTDFLSHFATFPEKLVEPCILAATSAKGNCPECGQPWARVVERPVAPDSVFFDSSAPNDDALLHHGSFVDGKRRGHGHELQEWRDANPTQTLGWRPTCQHKDLEPVPAVVLDPFVGSGTTAIVAKRLGRASIGIDLSEDYLRLAAYRLERTEMPLPMALPPAEIGQASLAGAGRPKLPAVLAGQEALL